MVKSKLDYLSKYSEKPLSKKVKKERKKKKKSISDCGDAERLNNGDDDDAVLPPPPNDQDDDEDEDEDEDERPIVVPSDDFPEAAKSSRVALSSQGPPRGSWNLVDDVEVKRRERHDSSDGDDDRPVRSEFTADNDPHDRLPSSNRRRTRHDSSDDDEEDEDDHDRSNRRKRNDSDDDGPPLPPSTRLRHDSLEEGHGSKRARKDRNIEQETKNDEKAVRKQRHDSSDDDSDYGSRPLKTTAAEKLADTTEARQRKRHDSSDDEFDGRRDARPTTRRSRHDSSDDDSTKEQRKRGNRNGGEPSVKDTSTNAEAEGGARRQLMSSGHMGGLQRGHEFSETEKKIQARRRMEALAMVDKYGVGETVYRDAEGRKVDAEDLKKKKETPKISEEEQRELNRGRVQKEQDEARKREMEELQNSSFARTADDAALDAMQKNIIREGDPMAQAASAKRDNRSQQQNVPGLQHVRPVYKGPAPKPNRFGIRPGYRWDGVDRGNGFEDKLLASQFSSQIKREEAYKWSTADM